MKDILEEIVAHKHQELEAFKQFLPPRQLYSSVEADMAKRDAEGVPSMREALLASDTGIIAEFKRKSPSKGWINKDAKADVVPLQYQENGAAALSRGRSVLTPSRATSARTGAGTPGRNPQK